VISPSWRRWRRAERRRCRGCTSATSPGSRKRARNRLGDLVAHGYLTKAVQPALAEHDPEREKSGAVYLLGPRAQAALRLRSLAGEHLHGRRALPRLSEHRSRTSSL
jgi:hypothetical protein